MKTGRGRVAFIAVFVLVFGSLPLVAVMTGPAIGGRLLAVTVGMAECLGAVLGGWAVLMWQGKL